MHRSPHSRSRGLETSPRIHGRNLADGDPFRTPERSARHSDKKDKRGQKPRRTALLVLAGIGVLAFPIVQLLENQYFRHAAPPNQINLRTTAHQPTKLVKPRPVWIVRTSGEKLFQSELVRKYARELDGVASVLLLHHHHCFRKCVYPFNETKTANDELARRTPNLRAVTYTDAWVTDTYPAVQWQKLFGASLNSRMKTPSMTAWWSENAHANANANANASAIGNAGGLGFHPRASYWVVEPDAAFSGDVAAFVRFYEQEQDARAPTGAGAEAAAGAGAEAGAGAGAGAAVGAARWADLVTGDTREVWRWDPAAGRLVETSRWAALGADGHWRAGSTVDFPVFIYKAEHVERYSGRLLAWLDGLFRLNVVAQDEVLGASVCAALPWCSVRPLSADGFTVAGGAFGYNKKVGREEWAKIRNKTRARAKARAAADDGVRTGSDQHPPPGQWYHALKWKWYLEP